MRHRCRRSFGSLCERPESVAVKIALMRNLTFPRNNRCAPWLSIVVAVLFGVLPARAQDRNQGSSDERRCTGQIRISIDERVASCTTLIDSGHYQPANLAILHDNRGMAFRAKGDPANARKDFDAAISLSSGYARAYANRASLLLAQHDLDGAITDLNQAITLDATDAGAFMTRGNTFDEKNDFDHAIADYNEAVRLAPNYAAAYFNRGLAFRRKGDLDHAIADYDQAVRLDPKNTSAINNRGIAWFTK